MSDMVLLLNNDEVQSVFDVQSCLRALEQAYRAQSAGRAVMRQRTQSYVPLKEPHTFYCIKTMEGALVDGDYMALRITSDILGEETLGGVLRRIKLPRGPGETYCGLILLFSLSGLAPVAIIQDAYIQIYRVACTSALSAQLLACNGAGDLGLIGSGVQAWAHLVAINAIFQLRRVRVFSPTSANRESFAVRAREELSIAVTAVDSARAAVKGADLVVLATNTTQPVIEGAWLSPGVHVISIVSDDNVNRRRELDDESVRRAALVVAHSRQSAQEQQQGDLWDPVQRGILCWENVHEFSDVVAGTAPARERQKDITVFKNNIGIGLQFAAVAPQVYERALSANVGRLLPVGWFVQKIEA